LTVEFGADQVEEVARFVTASRGLALIEIRRDLQDIPRVAVMKRS
jgi:hypothetical protein